MQRQSVPQQGTYLAEGSTAPARDGPRLVQEVAISGGVQGPTWLITVEQVHRVVRSQTMQLLVNLHRYLKVDPLLHWQPVDVPRHWCCIPTCVLTHVNALYVNAPVLGLIL